VWPKANFNDDVVVAAAAAVAVVIIVVLGLSADVDYVDSRSSIRRHSNKNDTDRSYCSPFSIS